MEQKMFQFEDPKFTGLYVYDTSVENFADQIPIEIPIPECHPHGINILDLAESNNLLRIFIVSHAYTYSDGKTKLGNEEVVIFDFDAVKKIRVGKLIRVRDPEKM